MFDMILILMLAHLIDIDNVLKKYFDIDTLSILSQTIFVFVAAFRLRSSVSSFVDFFGRRVVSPPYKKVFHVSTPADEAGQP